MARGRTTKSTKKFESKHLARTIETRRIQKKNKDKYNKRKGHNDTRKNGDAIASVEEPVARKTPAAKGALIEGMIMDEFLESGGDAIRVDSVEDTEELEELEELETSHKAGLESLKDKDPSFYEFLKQNDRELLEFDPNNFVEDEDELEDVPVEGGLTVEVLSNWEKLLIEEKSLGTLRKVLVAVRSAAANVTGEQDTGNAKYVLTDPDGTFL